MPDHASHLSQNLEIHHNYLELVDYYHQISKLFYSYDFEVSEMMSENDNFKALEKLFLDIQKLESYIALKHFPLINSQSSFGSENSPNTPKALFYSMNKRLHSLEECITHYLPSASMLLKNEQTPQMAHIQTHPQASHCWQQLSFDIGLMIYHAPVFDQSIINNAVDKQLQRITQEPHPWSPHRGSQKINYLFDRIHFMVSKLKTLVRLRTSLEQDYSDTLAELVSLSQILKEFELKIIKQKRAEEKRVVDMYTPPSVKIKK